MSAPTTPEAWWQLLQHQYQELRSLIVRYHPPVPVNEGRPPKISAPRAEALCEQYRKDIKQAAGAADPVATFDRAVTERDAKVVLKILGETWIGVPEDRDLVNSLPGFFALCDLCSECYLVLDDPGEADCGNFQENS